MPPPLPPRGVTAQGVEAARRFFSTLEDAEDDAADKAEAARAARETRRAAHAGARRAGATEQ